MDTQETILHARGRQGSRAIGPFSIIVVCVVGMEVGGAALIIGAIVLWLTTCSAFLEPFQAGLATAILSLAPRFVSAGVAVEAARLLDVSPGVPMVLDGIGLIFGSVLINFGSAWLWNRFDRQEREEVTKHRLAVWDAPDRGNSDCRLTSDVVAASIWRGLDGLRTCEDSAFSRTRWIKEGGGDGHCCRLRFMSHGKRRQREVDLVVRASQIDARTGEVQLVIDAWVRLHYGKEVWIGDRADLDSAIPALAAAFETLARQVSAELDRDRPSDDRLIGFRGASLWVLLADAATNARGFLLFLLGAMFATLILSFALPGYLGALGVGSFFLSSGSLMLIVVGREIDRARISFLRKNIIGAVVVSLVGLLGFGVVLHAQAAAARLARCGAAPAAAAIPKGN